MDTGKPPEHWTDAPRPAEEQHGTRGPAHTPTRTPSFPLLPSPSTDDGIPAPAAAQATDHPTARPHAPGTGTGRSLAVMPPVFGFSPQLLCLTSELNSAGQPTDP